MEAKKRLIINDKLKLDFIHQRLGRFAIATSNYRTEEARKLCHEARESLGYSQKYVNVDLYRSLYKTYVLYKPT